MKNSETGEFEIPLGSRHMLSVLFVVILLVGVAFAMGYVVGQNTHCAKVETTTQAAPPATRQPQAAPASASTSMAEPAPGSYWQVKALRKDGAEAMVRQLRDMGLPAVMSPSPAKPALMRVLVGPYSDTETMGPVKARLERAGLPPIRINLK